MENMQMRLFDKFSLSNGDQTIGEKELHSNKLVRLLVYILLHRERNVPHQELVDIFGRMSAVKIRKER